MSFTSTKKTVIVNRPQTLDELLRLSSEELARCDIARRNLLCATGLPGAESLDVDELLDRLDAWAERIGGMTESHRDSFHRHPALFENSEPLWRMLCLTRILEQEYHIHYQPDCIDREPDWGDSTTLLLHGLLGPQRHGTCPSLPVLVVAVGRRLSYPRALGEGLPTPPLGWTAGLPSCAGRLHERDWSFLRETFGRFSRRGQETRAEGGRFSRRGQETRAERGWMPGPSAFAG